jgi:hypothetical protein
LDFSFIWQHKEWQIFVEEKMQKARKGLFSLFKKTNPLRKLNKRKSRAQSLVEVAIAFPLLIMLFSGMVEFGFMLNTYLSLLDATRQEARALANSTPFTSIDEATHTIVDDMAFYNVAVQGLLDILNPPTDPRARHIILNSTRDDIVISVLRVNVSDSTNTITSLERFPQGQPHPYYQRWGNQLSGYADNSTITGLMTRNGATPVRSGILIIEVYYGYDGVLKLPWVTAFMNTITLHADTVMPLVSAKPPRTP